MSKASDLTFIRTQASAFAWAAVAAHTLNELGVLGGRETEAIFDAAVAVVKKAKEDPKFVGGTLPHAFRHDTDIHGCDICGKPEEEKF